MKWIGKNIVWGTLVMLVLLLFFQVNWIVHSVKFQEKVFRNSVDLALDKTIANLNNDRMVCNAMRECMGCDTVRMDSHLMSRGIWSQIHSIIDAELAAFDIDLEYDLFITKDQKDTLRSGPVRLMVGRGTCYTQSLRELLQTSGYELVVTFPDKTRFLLNKAGLMLISSVLLILLIIFSIFQMVRLYRNELRLSENIRELINNVTHEFKTPITSISLAANLIRKGKTGDNPEKQKEYGDLIFRENQKLQRQVEALLDMAALEREEFEYFKKKESVSVLVSDAVESVKLLLEDKKGTISLQLDENDDTVMADRQHLTSVFVNLLTNALKYSEKKPEIHIRSRILKNEIVVEFSDNGIGIPGKYQKYIFDKYFRVPTGDVHDNKGFGIGLSYVKSVLTAHQGKVTVSSEPGKGSTFTVILPKSVSTDE